MGPVEIFFILVVVAVVAAIIALVPAFKGISPFSWFVRAGLGAVLYWVVARGSVGQQHASEA